MHVVPSVSGAFIAVDMAFTLKRFTRAVMAVKSLEKMRRHGSNRKAIVNLSQRTNKTNRHIANLSFLYISRKLLSECDW